MEIRQIEDTSYMVSDTGRVFNSSGKELKRQKNKDGYWTVNLKVGDKFIHRRVNRLVAQAFIKNEDNLPIVNHIDHDRGNDNLCNLEWVTHKENVQKSIENDWRARKSRSILTEEQVHVLCKMIEEGYRNKEISEKFIVSMDVVKDIRRGRTWKEVSKNYKLKSSSRGVSTATVRWVCRRILEGLGNREIVRKSTCPYVTEYVVSNIRTKRSFKEVSDEYF